MKLGNEFRVGLWTIVSIVVLIFGVKYLKGQLHSTTTYYMLSPNVDGLAESSHVEIDGYKVGFVRSLDYDYNRHHVVIELNIDPDLKIPADSHAFIEGDLLNSSTIRLQIGSDSRILHSGDTIQGGNAMPSMLDQAAPMLQSVTCIMPKIDSLLTGMNRLVNESKMQETLLEVNVLVLQLQRTMGTLNQQLPKILSQVNDATANLDTLSLQLKEAQIEAIIANANSTLEHVDSLLSNINSTEGTAGKLINSDELHTQLTNAIADVDSLVNDIKENPKRYINIKVFGK